MSRLLHERGMAAVNLSALRLEWPAAVEIFPRLLHAMGGWPTTRLVLFGADPDMTAALRRCCVPRHVPLVADLDTALLRVYDRPRWTRRRQSLPAGSTAPRIARAMMHEACSDWHIDQVADHAALVANELVTNAVQHAGTRSVLTTEWDVPACTSRFATSDPRPARRQSRSTHVPPSTMASTSSPSSQAVGR